MSKETITCVKCGKDVTESGGYCSDCAKESERNQFECTEVVDSCNKCGYMLCYCISREASKYPVPDYTSIYMCAKNDEIITKPFGAQVDLSIPDNCPRLEG